MPDLKSCLINWIIFLQQATNQEASEVADELGVTFGASLQCGIGRDGNTDLYLKRSLVVFKF